MSDQDRSGGSQSGDTTMLLVAAVGKPIAQGTAAGAAAVAAGSALAASGIPIVSAVGGGVATVAAGGLTAASTLATGVGATAVASGITGATVAATAVGVALAPLVAPVAVVAGIVGFFAWLGSDE